MNRSDDDVTPTREWITFWDRANRGVFLLGNRAPGQHHWTSVKHDPCAHEKGEYDIWSTETGEIVTVEVHLDEADPTTRVSSSVATGVPSRITNHLAGPEFGVVCLVAPRATQSFLKGRGTPEITRCKGHRAEHVSLSFLT